MAAPSQPSRLERLFMDVFGVGCVALLIASAADTFLVAARAQQLLALLPLYAASAFAASVWLAFTVTALATPVLLALSSIGLTPFGAPNAERTRAADASVTGESEQRFGGRVKQGALLRVALGWLLGMQVVAAIALLLLKPWDMVELWPYWFFASLGLLGAVLGVALDHKGSARLHTGVFAAIAVVALAFDAWAFRRLYLRLHVVLFFVATVSGMAAVWPWRAVLRPWRLRALALLALCHGALLCYLSSARLLGETRGTVQPKLFGFLHAVLDFDRDGHSAVFGGGDCDDFNENRHPGACETPGNQLDDNCNALVDGAPTPMASALAPMGNGAARNRTAPGSARSPLPDVYLMMVDTLRADGGSQGHLHDTRRVRAELAPELDAFSNGSLDFSRAYTAYPSTFRAMLTMLQSRWWRNVTADSPGLLGWLRRLGYDTQLWIRDQRPVERDTEEPVVGFDRSTQDPFIIEHAAQKGRWTEALVDAALAEMNRDGPPRFRWLHVLDPHAPLVHGSGTALERYQAEVRRVSGQFGRLLGGLNATPRGQAAVVIFLADHGEEFDDHGARFHGATLYEENVRVPLLMHLPGVEPRRIDEPASLLDIVPTLAAYLGVSPLAEWQGVNWLQPPPTERAVFTQIEPVRGLGGQGRPEMHAVIFGHHKLIANIDANLVELFDLSTDPYERDGLPHGGAAAIRQQLLTTLAHWQDAPDCRAF